jgi:hypothetical protein
MDDNIRWFMNGVGQGRDMDIEIEAGMLDGDMMIHRDMEIATNGMILGRRSVSAGIGVDTVQHIISLTNVLDHVIRPGDTLLEVDRFLRKE